MTSLVRWDPFAEMRHAMEHFFDDFRTSRLWRGEAEMAFPVDLYETDDAVVVKAVLPGIRPEEVNISITGDSLQIKGEVKHEEKVERENYYRQEIRYGAFSRSIPLPTRVDYEQADAQFEQGILTVKLPKAAEVRPKTIKVKAKELTSAR